MTKNYQDNELFGERYGETYKKVIRDDGDTSDDCQRNREAERSNALHESIDMTQANNDEDAMIEEIIEFEDAFPDGVYAVPSSPESPRVKVRALSDYCKRHGKKPSDLSEEEMECFLDRNHNGE
ncbi:hypothetical protein ACFCP7_24590 [Paenibacillus elgii]